MNMPTVYQPQRAAASRFESIRGLNYHVNSWGDASLVRPDRPPLVLVHGWMDVGASYQFVVDALARVEGAARWVLAPDWRGFGRSASPGVDSYWFPDYVGDLDALLDRLSPDAPVDLVGHSMGGNVVMLYAGTRPQRIRRLVNLEGFGMPATQPSQAPQRLAQWLDELKKPERLRPYADGAALAARLMANDPLLSPDKAAWLAPHWGQPTAEGPWELQADPAHKRINPVLYQVPEVLATWQNITAPLMWVEGDQSRPEGWWGDRYSRPEFYQRLSHVKSVQRQVLSPSGHMLHHDQPEALAALLHRFLA
jgi:pimeloyl-ACP methyl ester carboxylesterase